MPQMLTPERRSKCVSYFDVSKAFDTVWTNGLFYKLFNIGITGKHWRILYEGYVDFKCKVRVDYKLSDWYVMQCGIHQIFLSLMKYTAFIDSLLTQLEQSHLCCRISQIPSSPAGYADATISKPRTDSVHRIVYEYGCKWRFKFNVKKSAVLVCNLGLPKGERGNKPYLNWGNVTRSGLMRTGGTRTSWWKLCPINLIND